MTLLYGPYSPPITGQSMAFRTIVDSYRPGERLLVDTTKFSNRLLNSLYVIALCKWLFFTKRIDTVYFTCTRSVAGSFKDIILLILCRIFKPKVFNHLHGGDFKSFYNKYPVLLKPLLKYAYKTITTSVVLVEGMKKEFDMFPQMKKIVVPNFYPSDFEDVEMEEKQQLVVTYFSNLLCSKGIFDFLEAARLVHEKDPTVKFKVAGAFTSDHLMTKGEVKKRFESFIQDHPNVIEFVQKIEPEERKAFLSQSSILVLPTYYPTEGFPLAIIEAMRCGNAIITAKHNYLPEVVKKANGWLVDPRSPDQMAERILKYRNDPDLLRITQLNNMQEAREKYSEEKYVQAVRGIIGKA